MLEKLLALPNTPPCGLVMAFDFGLKRIGCAIGQAITATASPLKVFISQNGVPPWSEIMNLIRHWQPEVLLVGVPLYLDGSSNEMSRKACEFAGELTTRYALPVFGVDESLTSVTAEAMIQTTEDKNLRKQNIDSLSAKIMLEIWFEKIQQQRTYE